jgi:hypothetical protein
MSIVAEIVPAEEFVPSPEDEAWACQALNGAPTVPTGPVNGVPMTLAEVIDDEARAYRSQGTPIGDFLGRQMERLAQLVRWSGGSTPTEHEDRMLLWDEEIRAREFDRGYSEGVEATRRELAVYMPR